MDEKTFKNKGMPHHIHRRDRNRTGARHRQRPSQRACKRMRQPCSRRRRKPTCNSGRLATPVRRQSASRSIEGDNRSVEGDSRAREGDRLLTQSGSRSAEGDERAMEGARRTIEGDVRFSESDSRITQGDGRAIESERAVAVNPGRPSCNLRATSVWLKATGNEETPLRAVQLRATLVQFLVP